MKTQIKFQTLQKLKSHIANVKKQGPRLFLRGVRILRKRIWPSVNLPTDRML